MSKLKVMFLCTGNSCRSQMAEGWARHLKGDVIDAYSSGVDPHALTPPNGDRPVSNVPLGETAGSRLRFTTASAATPFGGFGGGSQM